MDDQTLPADSQIDPVCPWCSAELVVDAAVCPSCGAILTSDEEHDLPGVTTVDAKAARVEKRPGSRSRLLSWISGEYGADTPTSADPGADAAALALPDADVQREILRLELEAEMARVQGEADSMVSDAMAEGRVMDLPEELRPPVAAGEVAATEDGSATDGEDAPLAGQTPA